MTLDENNNIEIVSKSALKREMQALQKLGQTLLDLPISQADQLPLSDELRDAMALYKRLHQREAKRRQLQYIGKLMRNEDQQGIHEALGRFEAQDKVFQQHFHTTEQLRDKLIAEGDTALGELLNSEPHLDRQHLRQLIRQAQQEQRQNKPPATSRKLFRYLRDSIDPLT